MKLLHSFFAMALVAIGSVFRNVIEHPAIVRMIEYPKALLTVAFSVTERAAWVCLNGLSFVVQEVAYATVAETRDRQYRGRILALA